MKPKLNLKGLSEASWKEHLLRFLFGGFVTLGASFIALRFGPVVGGAFLAFPAILPAGLTLAVKHGGRDDAVDEARGATVGAAGLAAFGAAIMAVELCPFPLVLVIAILIWMLVGSALWLTFYGRRT